MRIGHHIRGYQEEIIQHTQELVRIRSVQDEAQPGMPYGPGVHEALTYMLRLAEQLGFKTSEVDGHAGHAEYGDGDEIAAILVHLDTVELGDGWSIPPLSGQIVDGRIYGRGTFDDKGPAVVALYALKALKDQGIVPRRKLRVIFGTNEESGMADMDHYFSKEPLPSMAFCPDAGYPIFNVELGNLNVLLHKEGDPSPIKVIVGGPYNTFHPGECRVRVPLDAVSGSELEGLRSDPSAAVVNSTEVELTTIGEPDRPNAIVNMLAWLDELGVQHPLLSFLSEQIGEDTNGRKLELERRDEMSGGTQVYIKQLRSTDRSMGAIVNIRYPVSFDGDDLAEVMKRKAAESGLKAQVVRHLRPVYVPPEHPVIQCLSLAYEKMTGEKAELLKMGAGTYSRKLGNNGVAFGSGLKGAPPANVHQADEYVVIADLMTHAEICLQGLYELSI